MRRSIVTPILLGLLALSCGRDQTIPIVRETTAMNTFVTISVYDEDVPGSDVIRAIDSAFAEIARVEAFATDYSDISEVGRANAASGIDTVQISEELASLIRTSLAYGDSSAGAFDATIGPLSHLWDFLAEHPRVPPASRIDERRHLVDYRRVSLRGRSLFLPLRGMMLDLGGIGKGYAVDRAVAVLSRYGIRKAIVDIGGNLAIRWAGTHGLDSTVARISVRHPRREGRFLGTFMCGEGGISTSGDYQRSFLQEGKRYHHILDPATGYPAAELVSVTIVSTNATDADAISTLVFILGRQKGMEYIRKSRGVEGMLVYEQADTLVFDFSPGFSAKFERIDD